MKYEINKTKYVFINSRPIMCFLQFFLNATNHFSFILIYQINDAKLINFFLKESFLSFIYYKYKVLIKFLQFDIFEYCSKHKLSTKN